MPTSTSLGPRGAALIKSYETLRLVAYKPTPKDRWTLGWGRAHGIKEGDRCTPEQAEKWFLEDTASAVAAVAALPISLTPAMVDALVSIVFNAGAATISPSSTIGSALRAGDYFSAWAGFALWRKQAGRDLLGLARRRAEEMTLFLADGLPRTRKVASSN